MDFLEAGTLRFIAYEESIRVSDAGFARLNRRRRHSVYVPRLLTDAEVVQRLARLDGWRRDDNFITKTFGFKTFMQGMNFLNRVARVAEEQQHHPDITVRYTEIKLSIQTHSKGGLTTWDFDLAREIDRLGS
jgi:4a-hydroxytetrahydrobiopterin dehydratase